MRFLSHLFRRKRSDLPGQSANRSLEFHHLERKFKYAWRDPTLLATAFYHRSFTHDEGLNQIPSNERLEFLGDAVLDLIVSEYLYRSFPEKQEGELARMKSLIVSRTVLAEKAKELELGRHILLGPGEEQSGGRTRTSILSDAFEAVLGALYLDGGAQAAQRFLNTFLFQDINHLLSDEQHTNYKSLLLEFCQAQKKGQPVYKVSQESGPDHNKEFTVIVNIEGKPRGTGVGRNKREAEQRAAKEAYEMVQAGGRP
jgi:ribonuclease-3